MKKFFASMKSHFDLPTLIVMLITFILFVTALFTKGLTHDMLLEAGVFLVSVKLLMITYRNHEMVEAFHAKLDLIIEKMEDNEPKA